MGNQEITKNENSYLSEEDIFRVLKENGDFEITPCDKVFNVEDNKHYKKLDLSPSQQINVNALMNQLPAVMAVGSLSQSYSVKFPEGLPHTLMKLKQGGYGSSLMGEKGGIVGHASFYEMTAQAAVLGAFTAMSVVSGQYFLSQINNQLNVMKLNMDKILAFLYGDKKAELMAEVGFARYAYQNYSSLMAHECQKIATITSLQEAKKVAMKDSEFYIGDLDSTVKFKDNSDIVGLVDKAFQIKESLELSMQLYITSNLLEMYYAQNYDSDYIKYIEDSISAFIQKCEKCMLGSFSSLETRIRDYKATPLKKIDKTLLDKKFSDILEFEDILHRGWGSDIRKSLSSVLHASTQRAEYYINDGVIYLKAQ